MQLNLTKSNTASVPMLCHLVVIVVLVGLIYYPAVFSEISIIDDLDMVNALLNVEKLDFWDIFVPRSIGGGYYRPLLGLSQYIDRQFWMMDSRMMHLENILFHLLNSLLVYLLAFRLSDSNNLKGTGLAPLIAALFFAFHPVLTESVNWISGRTDSMACSFILISAIFLFRYRENGKKLDLLYSGVALLFSLLAKEVAFGYLLALPFLLTIPKCDTRQPEVPPRASDNIYPHPLILYLVFFSISAIIVLLGGSYWWVILLGGSYMLVSLLLENRNRSSLELFKEHSVGVAFSVSAILVSFALFFMFRKIAFTSSIDRISNTLKLIYQDTGYAISIFLGAVGFYVKKFFWPLPLNFFILEIDPLYDFLGIAMFLLTARLVMVRSLVPALSIAGMCCVLPALPFAFATIAWTGYAERYIYISTAFWSIALVLYADRVFLGLHLSESLKKLSYFSITFLLLAMAFTTWRRNLTWQTNLGLIADTVHQSPRQKVLRGMYMLAFIRTGDLKSAREQYRIATSLPGGKYSEQYDLNMAGVAYSEGNKAEAEDLLKKVLSSSRGNSVVALKFYIRFLENELLTEKNPDRLWLRQDQVLKLYERLFELNQDPFNFYRMGQIHIARNDIQKAIRCFEMAAHSYPPGNMYGDNSAKIVRKLQDRLRNTN